MLKVGENCWLKELEGFLLHDNNNNNGNWYCGNLPHCIVKERCFTKYKIHMIYVYVYILESMSIPIGLNIHTNQACDVDRAQTII